MKTNSNSWENVASGSDTTEASESSTGRKGVDAIRKHFDKVGMEDFEHRGWNLLDSVLWVDSFGRHPEFKPSGTEEAKQLAETKLSKIGEAAGMVTKLAVELAEMYKETDVKGSKDIVWKAMFIALYIMRPGYTRKMMESWSEAVPRCPEEGLALRIVCQMSTNNLNDDSRYDIASMRVCFPKISILAELMHTRNKVKHSNLESRVDSLVVLLYMCPEGSKRVSIVEAILKKQRSAWEGNRRAFKKLFFNYIRSFQVSVEDRMLDPRLKKHVPPVEWACRGATVGEILNVMRTIPISRYKHDVPAWSTEAVGYLKKG